MTGLSRIKRRGNKVRDCFVQKGKIQLIKIRFALMGQGKYFLSFTLANRPFQKYGWME